MNKLEPGTKIADVDFLDDLMCPNCHEPLDMIEEDIESDTYVGGCCGVRYEAFASRYTLVVSPWESILTNEEV